MRTYLKNKQKVQLPPQMTIEKKEMICLKVKKNPREYLHIIQKAKHENKVQPHS